MASANSELVLNGVSLIIHNVLLSSRLKQHDTVYFSAHDMSYSMELLTR